MSAFATIPEAIEEIRRGRLVIVVDDEDRENEGDLVIAAQAVTPEAINFMTRFGRGLICVPVTADRLGELDLPLMVDVNTSRLGTGCAASVTPRRPGTWRVWPGSRRSASSVRFWRTTGTWPACRGWRSSPASTDSGSSPSPI